MKGIKLTALPSFCEVLDTEYGKIVCNKYDNAQTGFYRITRKAIGHEDMVAVSSILDKHIGNGVAFNIIDAGSHIGTWGLFFGRQQQVQQVWSYEPLPVYYDMICETQRLNNGKIIPFNLAVGEVPGEIETPVFDWTVPTNFGGIELGLQQREFIGQPRAGIGPKVPVVRLDDHYTSDVRVGLLKMDVEGMEIQALHGAGSIIEKHRPIMFVEYLKSDHNLLLEFFVAHRYYVEKWGTDFLCIPK